MLLGLEDLNQQELANKLAVTKGNMVGLVNRLSRRGFVKRVPSRKGRTRERDPFDGQPGAN